MKMGPKLTLEDARVIMEAAEEKSREIGVDMDIAITIITDMGTVIFPRADRKEHPTCIG